MHLSYVENYERREPYLAARPNLVTHTTLGGRTFTINSFSELKGVEPTLLHKRGRANDLITNESQLKKVKITEEETLQQIEEFHENGICMYKGQWLNGRPQGYGELYYPDGSVCYIGGWSNGMRHGIGTFYPEEGIILREVLWFNGNLSF